MADGLMGTGTSATAGVVAPPALRRIWRGEEAVQQVVRGYLTRGNVLVWEPAEEKYLRAQWHLVPQPLGTLVNHVMQNGFHGPPYQLEPEAVTLLLAHGAIELYDGEAYQPPEPELIQHVREQRLDSVMLQMEHYCSTSELSTADPASEASLKPIASNEPGSDDATLVVADNETPTTTLDGEGSDDQDESIADMSVKDQAEPVPKRAKRAKRSKRADPDLPRTILPWRLNRADILRWLKMIEAMREQVKLPDLSRQELATSDPNTTWSSLKRSALKAVDSVRFMIPRLPTASRLESLPRAALAFPTTAQQRRREMVYHDLVQRGYYLTSGIKFGGDYLVYPGDPYRYHSHFVARVVPHTASISPMDVLALGRLGTVVKKAPVLCSVDVDRGTISYMSIEWTGAN
ncbi:uncharacterized protein MONBRDRAFT_33205 [Monosiga brevicollis MX1]|uniref:tRNA-intron lyase n=1 Tax=Monosiga brevicollis TaxID=81824 RepID=A9V454_MONBE|nr:uncharacterized protein MONBRDRAFT_33205 [Monosiga brevicollis MX1]EDQ87559.1 predicted protein [Monosiga brevicollis MX1]|eukprot:XP_001747479.1 hypothetical protein [Monosiga brevicollis MX1]